MIPGTKAPDGYYFKFCPLKENDVIGVYLVRKRRFFRDVKVAFVLTHLGRYNSVAGAYEYLKLSVMWKWGAIQARRKFEEK